jgi:alanine racemase
MLETTSNWFSRLENQPGTVEGRITSATLLVDLGAIAWNFRFLSRLSPTAKCAAIVKGDAYGHGMLAAARTLSSAGAETFFVASAEDAVALAESGYARRICVLSGLLASQVDDFLQHDIAPVLNDIGQIQLWRAAAERAQRKLPAIVHFDTGMNRLGLERSDAQRIKDDPASLSSFSLLAYMTHFSAADDLDFERCDAQIERFARVTDGLPPAPASVANSAACFLGDKYHCDLIRPGKATFGINPVAGRPNPMRRAATVIAPIAQVRSAFRGEAIGYGSTFRVMEASVIATVAIGYANGLLRSASNRGHVSISGYAAPIIGRVSMDLITVDVTAVPACFIYPGALVEIIGPTISDSDLASDCDTIAHELLISLGHGCQRVYLERDEA